MISFIVATCLKFKHHTNSSCGSNSAASWWLLWNPCPGHGALLMMTSFSRLLPKVQNHCCSTVLRQTAPRVENQGLYLIWVTLKICKELVVVSGLVFNIYNDKSNNSSVLFLYSLECYCMDFKCASMWKINQSFGTLLQESTVTL